MKILIAGSTSSENLKTDSFRELVHEVTGVLISNGHELIVGSSRRNTADFFVVEKIKLSNPNAKITVFYHEKSGQPFSNEKLRNMSFRRVTGGWQAGRIPQIAEADAIVTLGGSEKTELIIRIAAYLDKPIVPIFRSGGASEVMWEDVKNRYPNTNDVAKLVNNLELWRADLSAQSLMDLIVVLCRNTKSAMTWSYYFSVFLLLITSIFAWFWSFSNSLGLEHISLFVASVSACSIGAMVPIVVQGFDKSEAKWQRVVMVPIASALLSFILYITYLFSGFIVNGDLQFFTKLAQDEHFNRVVLTLSIISLSGGVLLEGKLRSLASDGFKLVN